MLSGDARAGPKSVCPRDKARAIGRGPQMLACEELHRSAALILGAALGALIVPVAGALPAILHVSRTHVADHTRTVPAVAKTVAPYARLSCNSTAENIKHAAYWCGLHPCHFGPHAVDKCEMVRRRTSVTPTTSTAMSGHYSSRHT